MLRGPSPIRCHGSSRPARRRASSSQRFGCAPRGDVRRRRCCRGRRTPARTAASSSSVSARHTSPACRMASAPSSTRATDVGQRFQRRGEWVSDSRATRTPESYPARSRCVRATSSAAGDVACVRRWSAFQRGFPAQQDLRSRWNEVHRGRLRAGSGEHVEPRWNRSFQQANRHASRQRGTRHEESPRTRAANDHSRMTPLVPPERQRGSSSQSWPTRVDRVTPVLAPRTQPRARLRIGGRRLVARLAVAPLRGGEIHQVTPLASRETCQPASCLQW